MSTVEIASEKYRWLPNQVARAIKEMDLNEKEELKLDVLLNAVQNNKGHDKLEDRWVVADEQHFSSRLQTLLANHFREIEEYNPKDELKRSVYPEGYIKRMREELNEIKNQVSDDGAPLDTKKQHKAIEVSDEDLKQLSQNIKNWLNHVWSLRDSDDNLLGEYVRSMELIEDDEGNTDAVMTLDAYASEMIKGLAGDVFSFVSFGDGIDRDIKSKEGDEYVKKFYIECRKKLEAKVKEIAMKSLQDWQDERKIMAVVGDEVVSQLKDEMYDLVKTKDLFVEKLSCIRGDNNPEQALETIKKTVKKYVGRKEN